MSTELTEQEREEVARAVRQARRAGADEGFSSPMACALSGVSPRQIQYWKNTDVVRPSVHEGRSGGDYHVYSQDDIVLLTLVKVLLDGGVHLRTAAESVGVVRGVLARREAAWLVIDDQNIKVGASVPTLIPSGRPSIVVDLARIVENVRALVAAA